MGYELFITRTEDRHDPENNPITQEEWNHFVENHPDLYFSDDCDITIETNNETGESYERQVYPAFHPDFEEYEVALWWRSEGQITQTSPNNRVIYLMAEIAKQLSAYVIGEESERYFVESKEFADENISQYLIRVLMRRPRKTVIKQRILVKYPGKAVRFF